MTDNRELPRAAKALARKLDNWSKEIVWGTGERTIRVDGLVNNRPGKVDAVAPVESVSIRAGHVDTRWFVAIWVKVGDGPWKFDVTWRRWHGPDWPQGLPVELNASETTAYVTADGVDDALAAIAEVQAKAEAAAQKRATTRARNKAETAAQEAAESEAA